jgi:FixJ family two-component response regulator
MDGPPIVHIVDDSESVRRALCRLLRVAGYEVKEYASAEALLAESLEFEERPVVVLADLVLPGLDGIALAAQLGLRPAAPPVVFLSARAAVSSSVRAMKGGAIDFLEKPADEPELLEAVGRAVAHSRERLLDHQRLAEISRRYATLTRREREVLGLVVAGLLNKQVASELAVSEKTVKVHRARAVRKMGAQSLPDLVRMAARLGISEQRSSPPAAEPQVELPGIFPERT